MTHREFIHQAVLRSIPIATGGDDAVAMALALAKALEASGEAPWTPETDLPEPSTGNAPRMPEPRHVSSGTLGHDPREL